MTTTPASVLTWQNFPAGPNGFFRSPVLITGLTEAVLIDGGFTLPDGRALVEAIRNTGKRLTAIFISQSDPDYYFGLGPDQRGLSRGTRDRRAGDGGRHPRKCGGKTRNLGTATQGQRTSENCRCGNPRHLRSQDANDRW